jgi:hypothetical protein
MFGRITLGLVGVCCLVLSVVGTRQLFTYRHGVKTEATVLAVTLDTRYRSTNFKRNDAFYRVKLEYSDQAGAVRTHEVNVEPEEQKKRAIVVGGKAPFIYVPGKNDGMIGESVPSVTEIVVLDVFAVGLGLAMLGLAVFKK